MVTAVEPDGVSISLSLFLFQGLSSLWLWPGVIALMLRHYMRKTVLARAYKTVLTGAQKTALIGTWRKMHFFPKIV